MKKRTTIVLFICLSVLGTASNGWSAGALSIDIIAGHNLVVDSNATSPATYAPKAAFVGATVCNTGDAALADVFLNIGDYKGGVGDTPGIFPAKNSDDGFRPAGWVSTQLNNTGSYSYTLESGNAGIGDASRYIGTLDPDECRVEYWLISYPQCVNVNKQPQDPPCDVKLTGGIGPEDDLSLDYDIWATTTTSGVATAASTADFTMRNEISAAANKIWPNTASKVPDEYLAAIESVVGWGTLGPDGQPLSTTDTVYPGERLITTQGIWYDLGNVGQGFDNDGDLVPDQNAWLQPVGDPSSFDPACFRMVNVYGIVIVKLKTGGEQLIPFLNELYFSVLPDNTGVVGLVYYQFVATGEGCSAQMTPYQEAASGFDNEKFSADYGLGLSIQSGSYGQTLTFDKSSALVDQSSPLNGVLDVGDRLTYTLTADNNRPTSEVNLGVPDLGLSLSFQDSIPAGTSYVVGSAAAGLNTPSGTGTFVQGYTNLQDGSLTECTIEYNVQTSAYTLLYSTDGGATWTFPSWRRIDVTTTSGSSDVTSAGLFTAADVGRYIYGTGIPAGTTITVFNNVNSVTISANATATSSPTVTVTVETAPSGTVTDIRWLLSTTLELDGGRDLSRNPPCQDTSGGGYPDGTLLTSLPVGKTASVSFQVAVTGQAFSCNTGGLGFGSATPGLTDTVCDLVRGNNLLSGTVFKDDGTGGGIFGDGTQNGTEGGIGNASSPSVVVTLWYDLNGDGALDAGDLEFDSTVTDASGDYAFTGLPDGPYLVVARKYDGTIAGDGSQNAVHDFPATTGWGNTTYAPSLPLTTDQGIVRMNENATTVTLAVNIDLDSSTSAAQNINTVDFAFAPPLVLTKVVAQNPDADADDVADTSYDEGDTYSYTILLQNRLPSVGRQGPTGCQYTVWATAGATGSTGSKQFYDPSRAYDAASPNQSVAYAPVEEGANRWLYANGYTYATPPGNISKVEALYFGWFTTSLSNDFLNVKVGRASPTIGQDGITGTNTTAAVIGTTQIDSYIGAPDDLEPDSAIAWDITSLRPNPLGSTWLWTDFPGLYLQVNPGKGQGADQKDFFLDAIGLRVTTDADCEASTSTTLSPVPLRDDYDQTRVAFVSADPTPTAVDLTNGYLYWDEVGPILPGSSATVTVTVRALDVDGTQTGSCGGSPNNCNYARTDFTRDSVSYNTYYADGRRANDASDLMAATIVGKAELRGTVYQDTGTTGWANRADVPLPNVSVTLYACVTSGGALETGSGNKTCENLTNGNSWTAWATTTTNASGQYEFIGLDRGYYLIEVGNTDTTPGSGSTSPYGGTQTAEPDDDESYTASGGLNYADAPTQGTYNNTWGNPAALLTSTQNNLQLLADATAGSQETINGIDFAYSWSTAALYGVVWHDVDGDGTREDGEDGLAGFTVYRYADADADGVKDSGTPQAYTVTNAAGYYSFSGLSAAGYLVEVAPPVLNAQVWTETDESGPGNGTATLDDQIYMTLAGGNFSGSHDFGYTMKSTSDIGDTLFWDRDLDGYQDPDESGIADVTVWLYRDVDRDGTVDEGVDTLVDTDVSDASGNYLFQDLPAGSYVVVVDTDDSDFPSGVTATADPDLNDASIGDLIYLDANGNGSWNSGEDGIPGVTVNLYHDDGDGTYEAGTDPLVESTRTGADGTYLFTGLTTGSYFVLVDTATLPNSSLALTNAAGSYIHATPTAITLSDHTAATTNLGADAGYSPASNYAIGNRVWHDVDNGNDQDPGEVGLSGVRVWNDADNDGVIDWTDGNANGLWDSGEGEQWTRTDESGYYLLTGFANGSYTIRVYATDLPRDFTPSTGATNPRTAVVSSADLLTADFAFRYTGSGTSPTATVSGSVFLDLDGDQALDSGEALSGTTVNLLDADGNVVATTASNASGAYSFTGAFIGTYTVQAVDQYGTRYSVLFLSAGTNFTGLNVIYDNTLKTVADGTSSVTVDGIHDNLLQDYGWGYLLGHIGDTVYWDINENAQQDTGEPGIAGVTVNLLRAYWRDLDGDGLMEEGETTLETAVSSQQTTAEDPLTAEDEGGKYLFGNLGPLTSARTVTATLTAGSSSATITSGSCSAADVGRPLTGTGIPAGTTITACTGGTTLTLSANATAGGSSSLTLTAEYYLVRVGSVPFPTGATFPAGATATLTADPDNDGALCSVGNTVCDHQQMVRGYTTGSNYLGADFGYQLTGSGFGTIGDHLWIDMDGGGDRDPGERGIPYVTVWLDDNDGVLEWTDGNGNGTWDTGEGERWTQTDSDGFYLFYGLADGSYQVRVLTTDADWPSGLPTTPTYEATTSSYNNDVTVTITNGQAAITAGTCPSDCNLEVDFGYRYTGANSLSGTICLDDATLVGYCGDSATDTSGTNTSESPLGGIPVLVYLWNDADSDNVAFADATTPDPGDSFTLLGSTTTNASGDYFFNNVPDKIVVVLGISDTFNMDLTTTNATSSVEDALVSKLQFYERTDLYEGNTVTTGVRQVLNLAGDADNVVVDLDYAFDSTLGGTILYDFGDLPDSLYTYAPDYDATLLSSTGAQHLISTLVLGTAVTSEVNGKDSENADGDTDDGVTLTDDLIDEDGGEVRVVVSGGSGWLSAWIDWNQDGDLADDGEHIINQAVTAGTHLFRFGAPSGTIFGTGDFFARFRLYPEQPLIISSKGLGVIASLNSLTGTRPGGSRRGPAAASGFTTASGEVEDYKLPLQVTRAVISSFDAHQDGGSVVVRWETSSEQGTAGFLLRRKDPATGLFRDLHDTLLPALVLTPQGGVYRFRDLTAPVDGELEYLLVEVEQTGRRIEHGPYAVAVGQSPRSAGEVRLPPGLTYSLVPHRLDRKPRTQARPKPLLSRSPRRPNLAVDLGVAKLGVEGDGIRFLDYRDLAAELGIEFSKRSVFYRKHLFSLTNLDRPVAFLPAADNSGFYFYGLGTESPYARENVYWIEMHQRQRRLMASRTEVPVAPPSGAETFTRTVHAERDLLPALALYQDPETDYWLWDYFFAGAGPTSFGFRADGLDPDGPEGSLTLRLKGGSESGAYPDHHALVRLNGTVVADLTWDGLEDLVATLPLSPSTLADGDNVLEIEGLLDTGAPWSIFYLDSFDVSYASFYQAHQNRLGFSSEGHASLFVGGFTDPGILVMDVTDPQRPVHVLASVSPAGGGWGITLAPPAPGTRYEAVAVDAVPPVDSITADLPSSLARKNNAADYLIVTTRGLRKPAARLASLRAPLRSKVVDLVDVYDEFGGGIPGPQALRDFLRYAAANWRVAPRYVLLAGDGTHDYRDNQGLGGNLIPPKMVGTAHGLFPSDTWFARPDGGEPFTMAIGRLPVETEAELNRVVDKISVRVSASGSPWMKQVLMLADNRDRAGDFPAESDRLADLAGPDRTVEGISLAALPVGAARAALFAGLASGAGLVNYIGHAGYDTLADEGLLRTSDIATLANALRPTVLTAMTCLAGNFSLPGYPGIGELLLDGNQAGAAAVWAPTGMSLDELAYLLAEGFYLSAFANDDPRIGDAVLDALNHYRQTGNPSFMTDIYVLLGDPAMPLD
jgi:uncharacterized repeat protein (TIGR01451 family)